ncbi:hypothetical protein BDV98DRAFT_578368 [Pterulicium gracile]|uniref:Uncharacterized protein n=1 Tax=Pterulicium gracile TaxID=1884261 RepID=A0A5C3Q9F9_9AGAR|nr:hypothetical protein BDV98DRAFT_578368 [Pterula gracilis]
MNITPSYTASTFIRCWYLCTLLVPLYAAGTFVHCWYLCTLSSSCDEVLQYC